MNVIFMGTPDFSVPCLTKLIERGHKVSAVFTQPDKPVGRKHILTAPPVKTAALKNNIPVYQPDSLKNGGAYNIIKDYKPDVIIVVAYGKILPPEILKAAKYGCINVHASLLPKYRGASPIQQAVLNGDSETGVTVMQMDEGIDTGDMLLVKKTEIGINETSDELFDRLSVIGAQTLAECLDLLSDGSIKPVKQSGDGVSYTQKITKALSPIDWRKTAFEVHNQVRGLQTWPCAETKINGKTVKIHKTVLSAETGNKPGVVVDNKNTLTVCCGDGKCVEILALQPEGKKRMDIKSFLAGNKIEILTELGM